MAAIFYSDTLYGGALIRDIREAKSSIMIMMFLMKTGYAQLTLSDEVMNELIAAQNRGVQVFIILNYSRFENSVAAENWETAQKLVAGGCTVRMGPRNQTLHAKMAIIDMAIVYIGSHNITRGGLGFNLEVTVRHTAKGILRRAVPYFNYVWEKSTRTEETPPPVTGVTSGRDQVSSARCQVTGTRMNADAADSRGSIRGNPPYPRSSASHCFAQYFHTPTPRYSITPLFTSDQSLTLMAHSALDQA